MPRFQLVLILLIGVAFLGLGLIVPYLAVAGIIMGAFFIGIAGYWIISR